MGLLVILLILSIAANLILGAYCWARGGDKREIETRVAEELERRKPEYVKIAEQMIQPEIKEIT